MPKKFYENYPQKRQYPSSCHVSLWILKAGEPGAEEEDGNDAAFVVWLAELSEGDERFEGVRELWREQKGRARRCDEFTG